MLLGPEVINFLKLTEHKFIMLINFKIPTCVGILKFISMINTTSDGLKATKVLIFQHLSFYEQLELHAQLSVL